jgi:8-oxo-dGTP pyrophosphatase MutT (NUDIX family)
MPKLPPKIRRLRPTKEVSIMAWIEDSAKGVLLVCQATGSKLWTFPGGKVKRGESLVKARHYNLSIICRTSSTFLASFEAAPSFHLIYLQKTSRSAV